MRLGYLKSLNQLGLFQIDSRINFFFLNFDEPISQAWHLAMCHDYSKDLKFWWKLSLYPSMASFHVIQSFCQTIFQMSCGYKNISNPTIYHYVSRSKGDDSVDDTLETLF